MLLGHCLSTTVFALVLLLLFVPHASPHATTTKRTTTKKPELKTDVLAMRNVFVEVFNKIAILPDNPYESGRLQIRSAWDPTKCFDMHVKDRWSIVEQSEAKLRDCSVHPNDRFTQWIWLRPVGDTGFVVIAGESDQCSGEKFDQRNMGGRLDQRGNLDQREHLDRGFFGGNLVVNMNEKSCLSESRAHFVLQRQGKFAIFKNRRTGKCLSVITVNLQSGMFAVESQPCTSESRQNWYLCTLHGYKFDAKKCWP